MPQEREVPAGQAAHLQVIESARESSRLDLEYAELSDPGRVRDHNEDFVGCAKLETPQQDGKEWMFALADGVGGQELGEVASRTAIEVLTGGFRAAVPGERHSSLLQRLVQAANIKVYETGRTATPGGVSMATTIVACALRHDRATVAHVGDSRCYRIRRGHASSLTRDHTVANDQVRLGMMSPRAAAKAETRHVLSRSLGMKLFVNIDINEHHVRMGDVLLLCSDGLHGALCPQEIASLIGQTSSLDAAARALINAANDRNGSDNVSVALVRVQNAERVAMHRGRPYRLR